MASTVQTAPKEPSEVKEGKPSEQEGGPSRGGAAEKSRKQLPPEKKPPKLDTSVLDVSTQSRKIIILGFLVIGIFFGIGGTWVSMAELTGAIIAPGEISIDTERKTVQHLEGGIIKKILVRDGDLVTKGQPLIILDSSKIDATIDQLQLQIAKAELARRRFDAEKNLAPTVRWPTNTFGISQDNFIKLLDSEKKVFAANRQALDNDVKLLNKQITSVGLQGDSIKDRLQAEAEVVSTLDEELDAKNVLFKKKYIDRIEILTLKRALAERKGTVAQLNGTLAELGEKKSELALQISKLRSEYRQQATNQEAQIQGNLFELREQIRPYLDAKKRLTVTAPVAGEVVAMQVHSEGGVLRSGEPILDIVPKNSRLIVETSIAIRDITHVAEGQKADVQLLAYNQRTTPRIPGEVVYISADSIKKQTARGNVASYTVNIELDKTALAENDLTISAGMPANAFIKTKPRTLLDYILEPMLINFESALREGR